MNHLNVEPSYYDPLPSLWTRNEGLSDNIKVNFITGPLVRLHFCSLVCEENERGMQLVSFHFHGHANLSNRITPQVESGTHEYAISASLCILLDGPFASPSLEGKGGKTKSIIRELGLERPYLPPYFCRARRTTVTYHSSFLGLTAGTGWHCRGVVQPPTRIPIVGL